MIIDIDLWEGRTSLYKIYIFDTIFVIIKKQYGK
jgi:hypothetical protein